MLIGKIVEVRGIKILAKMDKRNIQTQRKKKQELLK